MAIENKFGVALARNGSITVHMRAPRGARGVRALSVDEAIGLAAWLIIAAELAEPGASEDALAKLHTVIASLVPHDKGRSFLARAQRLGLETKP